MDKIFHHEQKDKEDDKSESGKEESELHKAEAFAKEEGKKFEAYDKREGERERNDEIWGPAGARG